MSPEASAQDMSAIMEAYWHLSAKRFVDTSCMLTDKELLGKLPVAIQDVMYKYIKDDHLLQVICVFFFFCAHRATSFSYE